MLSLLAGGLFLVSCAQDAPPVPPVPVQTSAKGGVAQSSSKGGVATAAASAKAPAAPAAAKAPAETASKGGMSKVVKHPVASPSRASCFIVTSPYHQGLRDRFDL